MCCSGRSCRGETASGGQWLTCGSYVRVKVKLKWGRYHGNMEGPVVTAELVPLISDTELLDKTHLRSFQR